MSTPSPTISVIIVNLNGADILPRCIKALKAQIFTDFEIIIVDNNSSDGSADGLERHWPELRVVRLDHNAGFAPANNLAARLARGQWLALLNNDAFPEPDWLAALLNAAKQYPDFTLFGSKLIKANEPTLLDGTGDIYHISGLAWRRHYNHPIDAAGDQPEEIFSPNAAAVLYSRDAFLQSGGFDEDFFSYHEDVDLGFRLRLLGHRCLYVPDAVVNHIGSASAGVRSAFSVYHGHRNLVWSYFQNMPGYLMWKYLPAHLLANVIFLVYYSYYGLGKAIWRAKWDALRGLSKALQKRQKIQATRVVGEQEIKRLLNHEWLAPYLLGLRARRYKK